VARSVRFDEAPRATVIDGTEFRFIDNMDPDRDPGGRVLELRPASKYDNRKGLRLNKYGEGPFCHFRIKAGKQALDSLGVYAIVEKLSKVLYIGKCTRATSTLGRRFNAGYGTISPRNCYQGGQSTNCRVNHLILEAANRGEMLTVVFHRCHLGHEASALEAKLIQRLRPPWNISVPSQRGEFGGALQ